MFSIYGPTGLVFSGTLEALNRVRQTRGIARVRAINENGAEPGIEPIIHGPQTEAVLAYQQMLHSDLDRGPLYHATQIMSTDVIVVSSSDAVARAWRLLRDKRIHQAPVIDEAARLVGIVSERDLLTAIDLDGPRVIESLQRNVDDVMTSPVVAASPITDIRRIARVMLDHGVDGVPIVDEIDRLVGFVSRGDILRTVVTEPPVSLWR